VPGRRPVNAWIKPTACDWCGQKDHDPIKPTDND
jgi:hypothetical protein